MCRMKYSRTGRTVPNLSLVFRLVAVGVITTACADSGNSLEPGLPPDRPADSNGNANLGTPTSTGNNAGASPRPTSAGAPITGRGGAAGSSSGVAGARASAAGAPAGAAAAPPTQPIPPIPPVPPVTGIDDLDGGLDDLDVDPAAAIDCSFEFSSCVLRSLTKLDMCIDDFATCNGFIASIGDAGPTAVCSFQFSACVLDRPTQPAPCIDTFEACLENPPPAADSGTSLD